MKIKGSELIEFMVAGWPQPEENWYWDHQLFEEPEPDQTYDTDEIGPIFHQGMSPDPTNGDGYDLAKLIRAWRKARDYDVLTITVLKAKTEAVKAAIVALGVRVT